MYSNILLCKMQQFFEFFFVKNAIFFDTYSSCNFMHFLLHIYCILYIFMHFSHAFSHFICYLKKIPGKIHRPGIFTPRNRAIPVFSSLNLRLFPLIIVITYKVKMLISYRTQSDNVTFHGII